jgi:TRAP-type C4-dicarboxylate transport system permease small subunit
MSWFTLLNARLARWVLHGACLCLVGLGVIVVYGVVLRYVFNDAPPYVEQVALLLVISVAMFGASATVREAGHIGLDSLVKMLPARLQVWCGAAVDALTLGFGVALVTGSLEMAISTRHDTIPTLGLSEAFRYLPVIIAGVLIVLFATERLLKLLAARESAA